MNQPRSGSFAKKWLLPPAVAQAGKTLLRELRRGSANRELLRANRALHQRHAGRRVFILCSGPSIKTQNLAVLRGEICIGVSNFFVHPDYALINPRYHCIAPLHPPFTDADGLRWFREMEGPMRGREMFFGQNSRPLVSSSGCFAQTTLHYLALGETRLEDGVRQIGLDGPLPETQSVSLMALIVALQLGFAEIFLLGTDHTSLNFATGEYGYRHFYSGARPNALGEMPAPPDLEREFASYVALWRQYKALRAIAQERGVKIFNATRGGLLDVFPRVEFESLFPALPAPEKPSP